MHAKPNATTEPSEWPSGESRAAIALPRDTEWRVIDRPIPFREEVEWLRQLITHAPDARRMGWRVTARCAAQDEVRIFDVFEGGACWRLP